MKHFLRFTSIAFAIIPAALLLISSNLYAAKASSEKTILILGDSISAAYGLAQAQGWVALTATRIANTPLKTLNDYRIQNASLSGDTTAGGVQRLPALLVKYKPAIVVIELGGNDALRGLPLAQTEANFTTLIAVAKQANAQILLIPMQIPPNYGTVYSKGFNSLYAKLGKNNHVAVSPFIFKGFADDLTYFQKDRIHPTTAAQPMIVDTIWPALSALFK